MRGTKVVADSLIPQAEVDLSLANSNSSRSSIQNSSIRIQTVHEGLGENADPELLSMEECGIV